MEGEKAARLEKSVDGRQPNKLRFGPGLLVAAAFIGPGTVTTASKAGAGFGYTLIWAAVFSVLATMILQEMAARIGIVTGRGLGENISRVFAKPWIRYVSIGLVVLAIGFGNAAYQAGNLSGAAVGISQLTNINQHIAELIIGGVALALLMCGGFQVVQNVLIGLVVCMSVLFLVSALAFPPDWQELANDAFNPGVPDASLVTIIALIGTTVVPYNLFLHSTSSAENWEGIEKSSALFQSRADSTLSIGLGGLVTIAIMSTAVVAFYGTDTKLQTVADIASQLKPTLGDWAHVCFAIGLAAAGVTSAITAPLAAGYAISGALGMRSDIKSAGCRIVIVVIFLLGLTSLLTLGKSPAETLILAQAANGLLLPFIAVFLLIVVNQKELMGDYNNRWLANLLGAIVVLVTFGLGIRNVVLAFQKAFLE